MNLILLIDGSVSTVAFALKENKFPEMFKIRGVLKITTSPPSLKRKSKSLEESFSCLLLRELSSLQTHGCPDSVLFYQRKVHDGLTLEIQTKKIANKIPFRETGRKLPLSRNRFFIL